MSARPRLTTNQRATLVLVDFAQPVTAGEVAHQTGLAPSRVSWALASLLGRHLVVQSHGRYYSTALGQRALARRCPTPSTSSHPAPGEDDPTAARPHTPEDR